SVPPPAAARAEIRGYVASLAVVAVLEALVRDRSEIFFLRLFAPPEEIAFYSLAFGLATRVMVIPEIAVGALLPTLSALHGRGDRAAQLVASRGASIGMARLPRARVPVGDIARIGVAAALLFAVARVVAGDSHELPRLILAAAAGAAAFLVAAVATRALGPREWTLLTTSTRRLLAARAGGA